jgi:ELWxxDGT repeat protein
MAGPPQLLRDINTQPEAVSSAPAELYDQGSWLYFTAFNGFARAPWATDGTAAGTVQLAEIAMGATPALRQPVVRVGPHAYFFQLDAPWVTDGTPDGTLQLHPNLVGVAPLGSVNGLLLFTGGQFQQAREVWSTDGTPGGTQRLATIDQGWTSELRAAIVGNRLYFLARGANGTVEPWVSDGTAAGTHPVGAIPLAAAEQGLMSNVVAVGNYVLFAATTEDLGREIWRIDTANNDALSMVIDLAPGDLYGVPPTWIAPVGDGAVFVGSTDMVTQELWRTDGTAAGTARVSDAVPSESDMEWAYEGPTTTGRLFFRIYGSNGLELWTTNGTTATQLETFEFAGVGIVGAHYYFAVATSTEVQLWRSDGTDTRYLRGLPGSASATYEVAEVTGEPTSLYVRVIHRHGTTDETAVRVVKYDLYADTATDLRVYAGKLSEDYDPGIFTAARGSLYFDARDGTAGRELWISDGTPAGTRLLLNVTPETGNASSAPGSFAAYGDRLYFAADDGINGRELWRSDATSAGTELALDINPGPGSSEPQDAFVVGSRLLFFARDAVARESYRLWSTDGTVAGSRPLTPLVPPTLAQPATGAPCPFAAASIGPYAYFGAYESGSTWALWRSDGTPGGTARVRAFSSPPCWLAVLDDRLYFGADGFGTGVELWRYDPALGDASLVKDLLPGTQGSDPAELTVLDDRLLFRAYSATNSMQLWQSDGSAVGTSPLTTFMGSAVIGGLQRANTRVVFGLYSGNELWTSDGTVAGTTRVGTVRFGPGDSVRSSGRVFFASTGMTGSEEEPWVTDGTSAGTSMLRDLNPAGNAKPGEFVDFNGVVVFSASDGTEQRLWRSDGTAAGTTLVGGSKIINLAPASPPTRLAAGQSLFYVSNEGDLGTELFAFSNGAPLAFGDSANAESGVATTIAVLANDNDADGALDASSVRITLVPANGTAAVQASGAISYASSAGFTGIDMFSYTVADTQGAVSHPATVRVNVAAAPVAAAPPAPPPGPAPAPAVPPPSSGGGGGAFGSGAALALLAALAHRRRRTRG